MFLVSKVLPSHGAYGDTIRACEASLRRLNTDYLDLYLLHWWTPAHPIEETMGAMAKLVDDGKVRFAGVSNLELEEVDQAREALGGKPLVCNQVLYHLKSRGIEFRMIDECAERGVAIVGSAAVETVALPNRRVFAPGPGKLPGAEEPAGQGA